MRDELTLLASVLTAAAIIILAVVTYSQGHAINRLRTRIACLEHPHQESSTAVKNVNGKIVVIQPPTLTGCVHLR